LITAGGGRPVVAAYALCGELAPSTEAQTDDPASQSASPGSIQSAISAIATTRV